MSFCLFSGFVCRCVFNRGGIFFPFVLNLFYCIVLFLFLFSFIAPALNVILGIFFFLSFLV